MKPVRMLTTLVLVLAPAAGVANAKLVACVGDSITYGYGLPDRASNCYPAQFDGILQEDDSQWETQNFGANGATLLRNGDQPYIYKSAYNAALASEPEVVIILLGTNDSWPGNWVHKDDFIPDYLALIDVFAQLPSNPKIFVCCPPPIGGNVWGLNNILLRDEIIPLIEQLPTYREVEVIDLYTLLEDSLHLIPDGVHPNTEGANMIAELIATSIISPPVVDFNGDQKVDFNDFAIFAQSAYDDGELDAEGLAAFAGSWLWRATEEAWGPSPEDGAIDVVIDSQITLSWNLGQALDIENRTVSYTVYFGTDPDALEERDAVDQTSYDFTGRFMPLTTYYWRIDTRAKLNRPPFTTSVIPGNTWSFTMEP